MLVKKANRRWEKKLLLFSTYTNTFLIFL